MSCSIHSQEQTEDRECFYHSEQNPLSSSLLSKNMKIKIFTTIIFPVVLYGSETWSVILRDECRLRVFEDWILRRIIRRTR